MDPRESRSSSPNGTSRTEVARTVIAYWSERARGTRPFAPRPRTPVLGRRAGWISGSSEAWHCARTWRCIRLYGLAIKVEHTMLTNLKIRGVLVVLACIAIGCMTGSASAVSAQLAKKCQALTAKAFPPRVPGNPAAGSAKGTGQSQRDYFNKCVANGGKMDDDAPKQTK